ncbi:hypothetical protein OF83DRAFT_1053226 [Amylostereum chailletii]|nr:hypothetical protein OF83DRAFT_1053226 [Amylostereum chailletii]
MPRAKRASSYDYPPPAPHAYDYPPTASGAYAPSPAPAPKRQRTSVLSQLDAPVAPEPSTARQKPQRAKKAKNADGPVPEKRLARFKKACPQNIMERVERVMSQRFFMVDRKRKGDELREEFSVLGSTGNVYKVVIGNVPSCTCPDASKGNHCKHILFIFLKVLQVTQASGVWYQKALLTSELETVFAKAPLAPNALAHARVREAYARATGKTPAASSSKDTEKRRLPGPDDDCPICYEGMHGLDTKKLTFCDQCGNGLHTECFQQSLMFWVCSGAKSTANVTCVWCRAKWTTPGRAGASSTRAGTSEGYINLASVAGLSPARDTSSYYHGPRRGQRNYGYQIYEDDY